MAFIDREKAFHAAEISVTEAVRIVTECRKHTEHFREAL